MHQNNEIMNKLDWKKVFEMVCRWYVFIFLNFYGFGKIMGGQFYRRGQLPQEIANTTIEQASAYDLAWSFMGYSFVYILFIGVSQIIGAWLLLWNRTKLLGVMILFPIMVNIIVFDCIFLDVKDALVNAMLYFLMLIYILFYNKEKVVKAFIALTVPRLKIEKEKSQVVKRVGIVLLIMLFVFGLDQFFVNLIRNQ